MPTEQETRAFRDCFKLFSVLLDGVSGTILSEGLLPYLDTARKPNADRITPANLQRRRASLVRRRSRLDPLQKTFRHWARAERSRPQLKHLRIRGDLVFTLKDKRIPQHRAELSREVKGLVCLAANKLTVSELVTLASSGDDESLFRLVSLDKVFLTARFVRERIWQAQGRGERKFFEGLSKTVRSDAYLEYKQLAKTTIAAYLAWHLGFRNRTKKELFEFLRGEKATEYADFDSLNRMLNRIGLTRYKRTRR